jgi:hypothetical protein
VICRYARFRLNLRLLLSIEDDHAMSDFPVRSVTTIALYQS